jgi:hypothetical protein
MERMGQQDRENCGECFQVDSSQVPERQVSPADDLE